MVRFIRLLSVLILIIFLPALPVFADPGDETGTAGAGTTPDDDGTGAVWTNPDYPPPPPDYEGVWPPDGYPGTDGEGAGEGDGGDEGGWDDPTK